MSIQTHVKLANNFISFDFPVEFVFLLSLLALLFTHHCYYHHSISNSANPTLLVCWCHMIPTVNEIHCHLLQCVYGYTHIKIYNNRTAKEEEKESAKLK